MTRSEAIETAAAKVTELARHGFGARYKDPDRALLNAAIDALAAALALPEQTREGGGEVCRGCGNEIDPDVCGCGASRKGHGWGDGHPFVPIGCDCLRAPTPPTPAETTAKSSKEPAP